MSAKILCLGSAKGGSGKTGLCATLGTFLSQLKKRVLLIDSDFSTYGLTLLYLKEVQVAGELILSKSERPTGLIEALSDKGNTYFNYVSLSENLKLLPASYRLNIPDFSVDSETANKLKEVIELVREDFDFIIIDSQAGADRMAQLSMSRKISDEVIIVSEYDPMSAAGVERLKAALREDLTYDRTWVLLNKILPEFAKSFGDFLSVAKYLPPIPWSAEVVRAYARRTLAINSETGSDYTLSIIQLLKSLFGQTIRHELNKWIEGRAAEIRQPIEKQYADAEIELESILTAKFNIQKAKLRKNFVGYMLTGLSFALTLMLAISEFMPNSDFKIVESLSVSKPTLYLVLAFIVLVVVYAAKTLASSARVDNAVNEHRLERQQTLVEDKLKRLELLRSLEPEMLLSQRHEQLP